MSAITNTTTSNPVSTGDAFSSLSSDEFLQIIFTELQNQDPLEPQDTGAMIDQLSGLRAIESDEQMVGSLQQLVAQNQFSAASGLIGSLVSGISISNQRVADLVISVSQTDQGPVLNLFSGQRMFFDQVDEVVGPIDEEDDTPPVDDGSDDEVDGVDDGSDDDATDGVDDGSDDSTDDSSDDDTDEPAP